MKWKKAFGIGIVIAVVGHSIVISRLGSSLFIFPGIVGHFLITGVHGGMGILEWIADLAEIMINAAMYGLLIVGGFRLAGLVRGRRNP
jgi:hypothetical protein